MSICSGPSCFLRATSDRPIPAAVCLPPRFLLVALSLTAIAACDSGPTTDGACEPLASVAPTYGENASVAALDANGCRIETASAQGGPIDYPFGPERGWEVVPTFLIEIRGPINNGVQLYLSLGGTEPPAVGRYPVTDLRGADGRFGPLPAQFNPGAF